MSSSTAFDTTRLLNDVARETYKAERDDSGSNSGPQNFDLAKLNPNSDVPPPTDHGVIDSLKPKTGYRSFIGGLQSWSLSSCDSVCLPHYEHANRRSFRITPRKIQR